MCAALQAGSKIDFKILEANPARRKADQMDQLAIMRRANGELFTVTIKGKKCLAVWPNERRAIQYKARNPALLVFVPALVGGAFAQKALAPFQLERMGLHLFTDNGGGHFHGGHTISWQQVEDNVLGSTVPENGDRSNS
jgi:hypothetical protein